MKKLNKIFLLILLFTTTIMMTSCKRKSTIYQEPTIYEFVESDMVVETNNYKLPGKLTMPTADKKVPAVVFVHGSGANDMNESIGVLQLFQDLAMQLAKHGVASMRYDKRTYTYAEKLKTKLDFTIDEEVIDDVISAIHLLEENDSIGDIYIIGHSFGGQLAPLIANKTYVKGVIVLAGTTEHIIDIAMKQLKEQNSPYYDIYDPYDEYFRDIKEVIPSERGYFFMGAYETYWVSYNNIDITSEILHCGQNKKMLILQGVLDLQVKASELNAYKEILQATNAQYKLYENLNHMFVDGIGETIVTAYQEYKEVPNYVIDDIMDFIKG